LLSFSPMFITKTTSGRAIAQAVSRRLPTAAGRVRSQVRSCGICGGQSGTGEVFSKCFGFPCQSSFHQLLHNHHRSSGTDTIGQQWPTYQVDSVSPHSEKLKKKLKSTSHRFTFSPTHLYHKRTRGHCLQMFEAVNVSAPPLKCSLSLLSPLHFLF
jgi:hypothetical protein